MKGCDRVPRQVVKLQHAADNVTLFLCPLHYIVTTICMHAAFDAGNHDTNGNILLTVVATDGNILERNVVIN